MGLISRLYNFTSGDTIRSSEVNAELNQILNLNNGNLDQNNLTDNAVSNSKILADAVTAEKISGASGTGAVSLTNIPDGTSRKAVDTSQTADNISYAETTHKRSCWVSAVATIHEDSYPLTFLLGYARPGTANGGYETARLAMDLPDAAKLKLVKVIGYTDSTYGEINVQCMRKDTNNSTTSLASATATGGASSGQASLNETVDHSLYSYYFELMAKVDTGGNVANAKIYKIYIEYTTTNISQL